MFLTSFPSLMRRRKAIKIIRNICSVSNGIKKICIVGSGPAAFYTAQHVLKASNTKVEIYEKLPIPFGLIRYGVAPDHPEIKNVINLFTKIASEERVKFFGNVTVGKDIKVPELLEAYDAVVLAYGASKDKNLKIPGENSKNIFSAREFVGWYNGLPDHVGENINLDTETVAVVGQGNVALDVARILLRNLDELKTTDITEYAFETLKKSRVNKVVLIGRRGPLQVAFTIKELREMTKLTACTSLIHTKDLEGIETLIPSIPRPRKRLTELMIDTAKKKAHLDSTLKAWELKFFRSPKSIICDSQGKVEKMCLTVNALKGSFDEAKVVDTGEEEVIDCGLVLRSVGYQITGIDHCVPFDNARNVIPNVNGKVTDIPGLYCSGWVKTGPVGVILSTMNSSYETGEQILRDLEKDSAKKSGQGMDAVLGLLKDRGIKVTTFDDWLKIDKFEQERGKAAGKPRQKICNIEEMLEIARTN